MKIAYLHQTPSSAFAQVQGAQVHVINIIRGLKKLDHDVQLLTLHGKGVMSTCDLEAFLQGELDAESIARLGMTDSLLFRLPERAVRRLQGMASLPYYALFDSMRFAEAASLNLREVEVIHERYTLLGLGGSIAARRMKKPLVLEVNGDMIAELAYQGRPIKGSQKAHAVRVARYVYASASKIICVSNALKNWLVHAWGIEHEHIEVLANAADVGRFAVVDRTATIRKQLGLGDSPVMIFVGSFYPWHDLDTLLQSFSAVRSHVPQAQLLLVGHGRSYDQVATRREQLGLDESVIMTSHVPHDQVPDYLAAADIAVSPLVAQPDGYGGSTLKLFEYMAAGKAIVATRTGQQAEILEHGKTALLAEPGDIDSLTDALLTLLSNCELRQKLGQNARDQAVREHSWDGYARKLERIYEQVLAEHR